MLDLVLLLSLEPLLENPTGIARDVCTVRGLPDFNLLRLRGEILLREFGCVRLHGQPVAGGGPELVKLLVTLPAARGASIAHGFCCGDLLGPNHL